MDPVTAHRQIALVAHDNMKTELLDWAAYNRGTIAHRGTGTAPPTCPSDPTITIQATGRAMLIDPFEPTLLYQERLRRAEETRLAGQLPRRPSRRDLNGPLRRTVGDLLINAGFRMRGELPAGPQPTTRHAA